MTTSQAKIDYTMTLGERMDLVEKATTTKGEYLPFNLDKIPDLPFLTFQEFRSAIENNKINIKFYSGSYPKDVFNFFATSNQILLSELLAWSLFVIPIISLGLIYFYSLWWAFLILSIPISFHFFKGPLSKYSINCGL